ncbi:hypothetical protein LXL04_021537 [Taraxacum kok-saghyz]
MACLIPSNQKIQSRLILASLRFQNNETLSAGRLLQNNETSRLFLLPASAAVLPSSPLCRRCSSFFSPCAVAALPSSPMRRALLLSLFFCEVTGDDDGTAAATRDSEGGSD